MQRFLSPDGGGERRIRHGKEWYIDEKGILRYNNGQFQTRRLSERGQAAAGGRTNNVKTMKILAAALVLTLGLTACGAAQKEFQRGTVDGRTYTSEFLGFVCTVPAEYTYLNDTEMAELNQLAADSLTDSELVAEMRQRLEDGAQVQDMYAMTEGGLQTVNVMLSKLESEGEVDMAAFADLAADEVKRAYQSIGMSDIEANHVTMAFMDGQYEGVYMTAIYEESAPVYCQQVYMQQGEYVCVISFVSYVDDHIAEMMDFFTPVTGEK